MELEPRKGTPCAGSVTQVLENWGPLKIPPVAEVKVQRDQTSNLATAGIDQVEVTRAGQALLRYSGHVMPGGAKERGASLAELDFHADLANSMSTYRSRDISAP